jgi:hypothetical protein
VHSGSSSYENKYLSTRRKICTLKYRLSCNVGGLMATVLIRENGSIVVTMRLTLHPKRDACIINLVQNAPKGALAGLIRKAIHTGISSKVSAFEENREGEKYVP